MKRITSIHIDWYNNELAFGESIVHQRLSVYRNKKQITYHGYNAVCKIPQEAYEVMLDKVQCDILFSTLEQAERAREYDNNFIVDVCDGSAWKMRLRHSDNTITLVEGTIGYPTLGEEIEKIILAAIREAKSFSDPLIFGCRSYGTGGKYTAEE